MHCDAELLLLDHGSLQENLWGINLHPTNPKASFIEFDSMINFRPSQGNRSRGVDDPVIQKQIQNIVNDLVVYENS